MAEAVGILEVFGLVTAFVAGDAGCKAANVRMRFLIRINQPMLTACRYRSLSALNSEEV